MPSSRRAQSVYPLAAQSRRRRRVLHQSCAEPDLASPETEVEVEALHDPSLDVTASRVDVEPEGLHPEQPEQSAKPVAAAEPPEATRSPEIIEPPETTECAASAVHVSNPRGVEPHALPISRGHASSDAAAALRHLVRGTRPLVWVFTGDSHSLGTNRATVTYSEGFQRQLSHDENRARDVVIGTAVAHQTSQELLENFPARSGRFQPDVVSLMLGLSDVRRTAVSRRQFQDTLEQLVLRVRDADAHLLLQTPPYCGDDWLRQQLEPLIDVMRDVAWTYHLPCVDHWRHWEVAAADGKTLTRWLTPDRIHASHAGHRVMTALLLSTLELPVARARQSHAIEAAVSPEFPRVTRAN